MEREIILVPTDFTPVADCAIDHAIEIAKLFNHKICLLHVVSKKTTQCQIERFKNKLDKIAQSSSERSGIQFSVRVEVGSIFDQISHTADKVNAEFIIMGIHGKKGVQHIMGSYAYKVITSSKVPVMVVKKKHHHVGYKNIVLPVDFTQESSQKINKAIKFARYFDSVVHIIGIIRTKSSVVKIQKEALLKKILDYVEAAGVKAKAKVIIKPGAEVHDEVLEYAEKTDSDLIVIIAEKTGKFTEVFGRNDPEQIIDKSDIPVITVIPNNEYDDDDDDTLLSSFFDPLGLIDKSDQRKPS